MTELSQSINLNKLREISDILKKQLGLSDFEVKELLKHNSRILNIEPAELESCLNIFINELSANPRHIYNTLHKFTAPFTNKEKLDSVMKIIGRKFYISPKRMGYGLLLNPSLLAVDVTDENFDAYVKTIVRNCNVNMRFVRNLFCESTIFGKSYFKPEYISETINKRLAILNLFGITKEEAAIRPSIIANKTSAMRRRLKLALLTGQDIKTFAQGYYQVNERVIWARRMAQTNGQYPINASLYVYANEFESLAEISQNDALALYPLDDEAIKQLDEEFEKRFPEIDSGLKELYAKLDAQKEAYITPMQTEEKSEPSDVETDPSATTHFEETSQSSDREQYMLARAKRVLGVNDLGLESLKIALGNKDFDNKTLNNILTNFVTLQKYGFTSAEILASPKCLNLPLSDLEPRIKLSKINGHSSSQFLTRDYKFHQSTIFARTCGIKILTRRDLNVYEAESRFAAKFGGDTETLARLCVLDEKGMRILDSMYEKTAELESEKESQ